MPRKRTAVYDPKAVAIGNRKALLRERRGLNKSDLAAKIEITPSYVSALERGKYGSPGAIMITRIADALGTSVAYLLDGVVTPVPKQRSPHEILKELEMVPR